MCLDEEEIQRLIEGEISSAAETAADAHLDECAACRRLVEAAMATRDEAQASAPERFLDRVMDRVLSRGEGVGRYLVLSTLGRGAMGRVYVAYDPELDRRVALKLLFPTRGARRLLAREARALGKLSHPNVVQVYDVGEHQGQVFVAMELVEGQSLDRWCRGAPSPGWEEVLAAYLEAARGLSAAHAKGLVHRDVKPANILRGKDGWVKIADFGLATRPDGGEGSDAGPPPSTIRPFAETQPAPDTSVELHTAAGSLVGTPLYMAPEQHERRRASAASDQYSLCVSLYQGLYGEVPFAATPGAQGTLARLLEQKRRGPPPSPPAGAPVPAWIFRAIARGLAPEPEDRYPSMDALIAALREDPAAHRRSRLGPGVIAAAVAALAALGALGLHAGGALTDPCQHPEQQLAGVWDEAVKGRVRAAFVDTGRPSAAETATRVAALLDRRGGEWAAMRGEVCRAPRVDPARREILRLRDACLERRLGQLGALAALFAERPDPEILDRAVPAAAALPPVAYCADTEALTARVHPPEDPALRARVAALHPRVDRLEALHSAGKLKEGIALGTALLEEVKAVAYPPLIAQVEEGMGRLLLRAGDYEAAKAHLYAAAASASEGGDDELLVQVWARLLYILGDRQRRFDDASMLRALAPSVLARVHDPRAEATWLNLEGTVLYRMGRLAEARASLERALALREKALPPDHPDITGSLNNLGLVLFDLGDHPGALRAHRRALALRETTLGPDHPDVAQSLNNLGLVLAYTGAYPEALGAYQRAVSLWEKTLGPDHPDVATSLDNLGTVLRRMGDAPRARAAYERALAIQEKARVPDAGVAQTLAGLGRVLVGLGQIEAARPALDRALAMREKGPATARAELAEPLLGLGELHLASRRPAEAAPVLERALALDGSIYRAEIQLSLAEALWQIGTDRPRARALVEEAGATWERLHHGPGLALATRWLADHP